MIGSEIELQDENGEKEVYQLLGAWDGDPERPVPLLPHPSRQSGPEPEGRFGVQRRQPPIQTDRSPAALPGNRRGAGRLSSELHQLYFPLTIPHPERLERWRLLQSYSGVEVKRHKPVSAVTYRIRAPHPAAVGKRLAFAADLHYRDRRPTGSASPESCGSSRNTGPVTCCSAAIFPPTRSIWAASRAC